MKHIGIKSVNSETELKQERSENEAIRQQILV